MAESFYDRENRLRVESAAERDLADAFQDDFPPEGEAGSPPSGGAAGSFQEGPVGSFQSGSGEGLYNGGVDPALGVDGSAHDLRVEVISRLNWRRKSLYNLVLAFSLTLLVWAGVWGFASIQTIPARLILDAWEDPEVPQVPEPQMWQLAVNAIEQSRKLAPFHADHHLTLARLYHHRARIHPPGSHEAKADFKQAAALYQEAAKRRPSWGYPLLLQVQARIQAGEKMDHTIELLMRAIRLDPWSEVMQKTGSRIGFNLWPLLDASQKGMIQKLVTQALPRYSQNILQTAVRLHEEDLVRPMLGNNPEWLALLADLLKRRKLHYNEQAYLKRQKRAEQQRIDSRKKAAREKAARQRLNLGLEGSK
ncbi:MAG: hypothetical protein HQL52_00080 [Magnetococcales bacterium]|nr:hypothetical protein [Magnetococcales bacterium]